MAKVRRLLTRATVFICIALFLIRCLRDTHDAAIRESLVDFSLLSKSFPSRLWQPEQPVRWFNGSHIDDRYQLVRQLKSGEQGLVSLYSDTRNGTDVQVVVKVISAHSRSRIPSKLLPLFERFDRKWPSEIDASLSLQTQATETDSPFVPIHDYFVLLDSKSSSWAWTIVTPFMSGGTLLDLAHRIREVPRTIDELDSAYRPAFYQLFSNLRSMHEQGYCHDDVKPSNIFIHNPSNWQLGDLGNVRERQHAWHATNLWRRRNQWSDCRMNDIRRALKSYLSFLREASQDRAQFDWDFMSGSEKAWSKLYWEFVQRRAYSYDVSLLSDQSGMASDPGVGRSHHWKLSGNWLRKVKADHELLCTSLWYKLWLTF